MNNNDVSGNGKIVARAGFWYTICNFLFKGIAFLTAPIFARLLSKSEFGEFNNLLSWVVLLFIVTSLDLHTSIVRAKLDFKDDLDKYASSVLILGANIALIVLAFIVILKKQFITLTGINAKYIWIIMLYMFCVQGINVYVTKARALYKYKTFSIISGLCVFFSSFLSLFLVCVMDNRLDGRVYGYFIPYIVIGLYLYYLLLKMQSIPDLHYIKYAFMISLPLLPHVLSMSALTASDKVMIMRCYGSEETALYSIACIVSHIMLIVIDSLNKAWAPWFLETLKAKNISAIKCYSVYYYYIFYYFILMAIILGPEVVKFLGGDKYQDCLKALPPLVMGSLFHFSYTMYVQIEFYEKKLCMVSISTIIAAITNVCLNYYSIPRFGYVAASYSTLISYIVLFTMHFLVVQKMGYGDIFDNRKIISGNLICFILLPLSSFLYGFTFARFTLLGILTISLVIFMLKNYRMLRQIICG